MVDNWEEKNVSMRYDPCMPFVFSKELSNSFEKEGMLHVNEPLPDFSFEVLKTAIDQHLSSIPSGFKSRYLAGRDLFRSIEPIRKILLKTEFKKIPTELLQELRLLFAFDQIWDCRKENPSLFEASSLQDIMSVSPLKLGAFLCLEGEGDHPFFPKKPNEMVFFPAWKAIEWKEAPKGQLFLLLGYAAYGAIYKENERDPNTNLMKRLHYQANQPLHSKTHPLIKG